MKPEPKPQRFATIQTLRGIASLAVCWYHLVTSGGLERGVLALTAHYGVLGVQLFFVISGFVLPYSLWAGGYRVSDYSKFILKRLARLEPPYLISVAFSALATYIVAHYYYHKDSTLEAFPLLLHLGYLNAFWNYDWVNPVYWTLAIEFQYYLVIGLAFAWVRSENRWYFWAFLGACALSQYWIPQGTFLPRYWPLFAQGMAVFRNKTGLASTVEMTLTLGAATAWGITVLGAPAALAGLLGAVSIAWVQVSSRFTDWLGDISYSLYLLHFPIGVRICLFLQPRVHSQTIAFLLAAGASAVCCLAADGLYRWVELPAQRWASRIRYRRTA
jgi:peptidoglycan/LPS O-acetylase OafA/YrhL